MGIFIFMIFLGMIPLQIQNTTSMPVTHVLYIESRKETRFFKFKYHEFLSSIKITKASVTIMADFSPEFDPPVRWRSKHQTKNDC